jgi:hypothetical protein
VIRLLVIGRRAGAWVDALSTWERDDVAVDAAERPAEGIRTFDDVSPDMVAIADPPESHRIEPLVEAIRQRPLGQLVPVAILGEIEREFDDELERASNPRELRRLVLSAFELEGGGLEADTEPEVDSPRETQTAELEEVDADEPTPPSGHDERIERDGYVVEPLDDLGSNEASSSELDETAELERRPASPDASAETGADEAAIERKLRTVRHDDYFSILGVERSADTRDVLEAHRRLRRQFRASNIDEPLVREYADALDEIADALDDAKAVLGDETLREQYLEATTRK